MNNRITKRKKAAVRLQVTLVLMFVCLLALKLTQVIDWSWWWIASPLWAPLALLLCLCACSLMFFALLGLFSSKR